MITTPDQGDLAESIEETPMLGYRVHFNHPGNPVASLNIVDAGVNIINFWMREDGLAIDKFIITSEPDFVPEGFGAALTDGTSSYEPPVQQSTAVADTSQSDDDLNETERVSDELTDSIIGSSTPIGVVQSNDTTPANNAANEQSAVTAKVVSSDGLFGGSTSIAALFVLLFIRIVRLKNHQNRITNYYTPSRCN